jgi:hypothetical protein
VTNSVSGAGLKLRIVRGCGQKHADAPNAVGLLRPRHERPCCRAPEPCDKRPPPHS